MQFRGDGGVMVVRRRGGAGGGEVIDRVSREEDRGEAKGGKAQPGQMGSWRNCHDHHQCPKVVKTNVGDVVQF